MTGKLQPHEIEERAAEARSILNSAVFQQAVEDLNKEYIQRLIQNDVGTLTAATAHASMKVLSEVQAKLKTYINSGLIQSRR